MSRRTGRCTRWERWSPRSGQRLKVLTLDFSSLVLLIIRVFQFICKMLFVMGDDLSYGLNTLGPLCLWQCLIKPRQRKALIQTHVNVVVLDQSQNPTKMPWIQSTRMSACQRLCWDSPDLTSWCLVLTNRQHCGFIIHE